MNPDNASDQTRGNQAEESPGFKDSSPSPSPAIAASKKSLNPSVIGAAVMIGLLLVALVYLYSRIGRQKNELREEGLHRQALEIRLQETASDLSSRIEQLNHTRQELETSLAEQNRLREELSGTRTERDRFHARLDTVSERLEFFRNRLQAEEETVASLNARLEQERDGQRLLLSRVERLMDEKASLQETVSRMEGRAADDPEVDIPGLVVRRPVAHRQGTILGVNRRFDFAVVNLGERDGVRPGDRFRVIDRERVIGELVARRVEPAMTVADIDPETTSRRLRQDLIVTLHE